MFSRRLPSIRREYTGERNSDATPRTEPQVILICCAWWMRSVDDNVAASRCKGARIVWAVAPVLLLRIAFAYREDSGAGRAQPPRKGRNIPSLCHGAEISASRRNTLFRREVFVAAPHGAWRVSRAMRRATDGFRRRNRGARWAFPGRRANASAEDG